MARRFHWVGRALRVDQLGRSSYSCAFSGEFNGQAAARWREFAHEPGPGVVRQMGDLSKTFRIQGIIRSSCVNMEEVREGQRAAGGGRRTCAWRRHRRAR